MKKYLLALMVLVLALALVACGGEATDTTVDQATEPAADHVHTYVDEIIPATCATTGKVVSKCDCGDVQGETEIPLADHTASALECDKDTVCTVCNTVLAEKTGHVFGASEVVTAATCSTAGKEKGACLACGKIVESEIPATGHIAGEGLKAADGGIASTCKTCGQNVTLKEADVLFQLTFEEDVATEAAKYANSGLTIFKPETWNLVDGALNVKGNETLAYIDITDPSKLASNGMIMMSFDFTITGEATAGSRASVFSLLNFFYNGKNNYQGTTGWGWAMKYNKNLEKFVITATDSAVTDETSFNVALNTKYKVQYVFDTNAKGCHIFIDGQYIGNANQCAKIAELKDATACFRFGDGPAAGYIFDNFTISTLK